MQFVLQKYLYLGSFVFFAENFLSCNQNFALQIWISAEIFLSKETLDN